MLHLTYKHIAPLSQFIESLWMVDCEGTYFGKEKIFFAKLGQQINDRSNGLLRMQKVIGSDTSVSKCEHGSAKPTLRHSLDKK